MGRVPDGRMGVPPWGKGVPTPGEGVVHKAQIRHGQGHGWQGEGLHPRGVGGAVTPGRGVVNPHRP